MIKSIEMKNVATYSDEGIKIDDCKKINFIYGANGSGKSTISNYLYDLEEPKYSSCKVEWEKSSSREIIVYNKTFRNRHLKEDIEGVFTLGESRIEDIKELDELKSEKEQKKTEKDRYLNNLDKIKEKERNLDADFRDDIWDNILKKNESSFREVFSGFRNSKEKFKNEVISRYSDSNYLGQTREELINRSEKLLSNKPDFCKRITINIEDVLNEIKSVESDPIWNKIVIGNKDIPISKLIESLDNADWVNRGRYYIKKDGICPFCQQKNITTDFVNQLDMFFSGEYEQDVNHLKELKEKYKSLSYDLISRFKIIETYDYEIKVGEIEIDLFNELINALEMLFENTLQKMDEKEKEVSKKIILTQTEDKINEIEKIIINANKNIEKHNDIVENYNDKKKELIDDVWAFLIYDNNQLIEKYFNEKKSIGKAKEGITNSINVAERILNKLDKSILKKEKNITSVQPTVDEINRLLKSYGFTNFQIVPSPRKENYYQIQRMDGSLATSTLSEGEETFISFLYFFQLTKGNIDAKKISTKKKLVLDDPISSLDSTVLYIVSSMVKTLIRDVRDGKTDVEQIYIFTHNVFFHKEASYIDGRNNEFNDVNYWIISKDNNVSYLRTFGMKNPIKTSYELLWHELRTNSNASMITIQNIMRRIIENYFGMLGKTIDDRIINSFDTVEEQMICKSLIAWINDGSHSIPDDLYIDSYNDSVNRYKKVFADIFIKMGHEAHYDMMMSIDDK